MSAREPPSPISALQLCGVTLYKNKLAFFEHRGCLNPSHPDLQSFCLDVPIETKRLVVDTLFVGCDNGKPCTVNFNKADLSERHKSKSEPTYDFDLGPVAGGLTACRRRGP